MKLFYTARDVADAFGIPKRTLLDYAKTGKIETRLLNNRYIFTKAEILRFAKKNLPAECFKKIETSL